MPEDFLFLVIIVSLVIWMTLSKEVFKPSQEINRPKMLILLSAGSFSTFILIIVLLKS